MNNDTHVKKNAKRIALSCGIHRWLVRNVLSLHQWLELVVPQWHDSQQYTQPAPLPLFLHSDGLFNKQCDFWLERLRTLSGKDFLLLPLNRLRQRCRCNDSILVFVGRYIMWEYLSALLILCFLHMFLSTCWIEIPKTCFFYHFDGNIKQCAPMHSVLFVLSMENWLHILWK